MNFLKQSMQGMGAAQSSNRALPPQLMGAIQDIKRMRAVCGGKCNLACCKRHKRGVRGRYYAPRNYTRYNQTRL